MSINEDVMKVLKNRFCRKRMISIYYLIKTFLKEMKNENYQLLDLKISDQTIEKYKKWWRYYKNHYSF